MSIFQVFILGIVEGITEFLPISSTAHLIITSKILQLQQSEFLKLFEVVIQSGAILAVVFMYFSYLLKHVKLWAKLIVSFIPTAIIGFLFFTIIKGVFFDSTLIIASALLLVGLLFIFIEGEIKKGKINLKRKISELSYKDAFLIGFFQSFAIVPGISRAGAVILSMMILGYKRDESATYSFLLAIPTILAASIFDLYKNFGVLSTNVTNFQKIVIGFIVSFIFAYISVKWLILYLQKNSLVVFGVYRIMLAIILLLFFIN
ncbi:MAG: undecaprenyl-diphosphate phosphatase [bacterium]